MTRDTFHWLVYAGVLQGIVEADSQTENAIKHS